MSNAATKYARRQRYPGAATRMYCCCTRHSYLGGKTACASGLQLLFFGFRVYFCKFAPQSFKKIQWKTVYTLN